MGDLSIRVRFGRLTIIYEPQFGLHINFQCLLRYEHIAFRQVSQFGCVLVICLNLAKEHCAGLTATKCLFLTRHFQTLYELHDRARRVISGLDLVL